MIDCGYKTDLDPCRCSGIWIGCYPLYFGQESYEQEQEPSSKLIESQLVRCQIQGCFLLYLLLYFLNFGLYSCSCCSIDPSCPFRLWTQSTWLWTYFVLHLWFEMVLSYIYLDELFRYLIEANTSFLRVQHCMTRSLPWYLGLSFSSLCCIESTHHHMS